MKAIFIIIILALIGILLTGIFEMYKETELQKVEIRGLKAQNKMERDSLESALTKTRDSLAIALTTIKQKHEETERAKSASDREIKKLKGILFVRYESDSVRMKALKELYKSYNP